MNENYVCITSQGSGSTIFEKVWPHRPHTMKMDKFSVILTGMTLSIEVPEIIGLINFYDND
jgi:hypothetical protein